MAGDSTSYWDPASACYRQADGSALETPTRDADRRWVEIDRDGRPVGAMVIDGALAEDPELVAAATSATMLAVENGNLEGELRESQARILAAGDAERRRIERDLHDGAQQRLVALRINLALAGEKIDGDEQRTLVEQLGTDVEEAIDDLRALASGVYPDLLGQAGVGSALRSGTQLASSPAPLSACAAVVDRVLGRWFTSQATVGPRRRRARHPAASARRYALSRQPRASSAAATPKTVAATTPPTASASQVSVS